MIRTFSSWVRCGPSPVSTLIARATGPCVDDPGDVRPQGGLVDAAVGVHRQDGGGDEAVEVQGHRRLRGAVETPIVIVFY